MKLILRPAMPPWSLIIRKQASSHLAMVPNAETGPLSEVVDPILISVAVTPGVSSAREVRAKATTPAAAVPASSERRLNEVMAPSPGYVEPLANFSVIGDSNASLVLLRARQRPHHLAQHHQHHLVGAAAERGEPAVAI